MTADAIDNKARAGEPVGTNQAPLRARASNPAQARHVNQQNLASDIWNIADTLRGDFKQSEFGRVILPFAVLRRLECVLEPTSC